MAAWSWLTAGCLIKAEEKICFVSYHQRHLPRGMCCVDSVRCSRWFLLTGARILGSCKPFSLPVAVGVILNDFLYSCSALGGLIFWKTAQYAQPFVLDEVEREFGKEVKERLWRKYALQVRTWYSPTLDYVD